MINTPVQDKAAKSSSENAAGDKPSSDKTPPAGTHDQPHLTDPDKTPGSGMLPGKENGDVEGPTG
jgi:hypothetical protein